MWVPPKIFGFPLVVAEKQTAPGMRTSAINLIHVRLKICREWQSQTDLLLVYFLVVLQRCVRLGITLMFCSFLTELGLMGARLGSGESCPDFKLRGSVSVAIVLGKLFHPSWKYEMAEVGTGGTGKRSSQC